MWEDRYRAEEGYLFGTLPSGVLTENPWVADGCSSALCVADGEGRNGVHLARAGLEVTSFDLSKTAVGRAEALARSAGVNVDTHISDWDGWDWFRQFDLVVGIFIQFMPPQGRAMQFRTMAQAVRPGGRLVLHGYTPAQVALGTGGPRDPAQMYDTAMLRAAFPDWRIERLAEYEREVEEGRGHSGRSALIDLVARKP